MNRPTPVDRHAPVAIRERAVLCSIGGELMEHHCQRLAGFCAKHDFGSTNIGVAGCGIWHELAPNELYQCYPPPAGGTQQLVCCCHRANASVEGGYEIGHRSTLNRCLGNNGADGREGVLDTMVEFGGKYSLAFFRALAFSHIDADTDHSLRARIIVVRN